MSMSGVKPDNSTHSVIPSIVFAEGIATEVVFEIAVGGVVVVRVVLGVGVFDHESGSLDAVVVAFAYLG